ncbi:MAG: hypothetical protein V4727_12485 [Verrucomicrobiota bacterium]
MNIDELITKWNQKRSDWDDKFERHFSSSDDLLAIVLRGHLLIEGFIDNLNRHCFHFPEFYDEANLTFQKKLLIAQAQILEPGPSIFPAIRILNELRNNLAHNLESPKKEPKINAFLELVESRYSQEFIEVLQERCEANPSLEMRVKRAISYVFGRLQVLDNFIEFLENNRHYGDSTNKV